MMDHLAEIDDVAVHDAVDLFEAQMELLVLSLLDTDHATALDVLIPVEDDRGLPAVSEYAY
jgi:hypothetical protein